VWWRRSGDDGPAELINVADVCSLVYANDLALFLARTRGIYNKNIFNKNKSKTAPKQISFTLTKRNRTRKNEHVIIYDLFLLSHQTLR
jgi:hypothetical protein